MLHQCHDMHRKDTCSALPVPVAATAVPSNCKNLWHMKISLVQFEDMRARVWSIKSMVDTRMAAQDGFRC